MNNIELSYQAHNKNLTSKISEKDIRLFHIKNKDCIYYQVIKRTLDNIQPFCKQRNNWLTIGDYNGLEANYLMNNNQNAVASDISDIFLQEAKKEGLISDCKVLNVENIELADNSFDYVFCKEAFHHFPKAYIGLYEMIRCSKNAAIIIEPIDIITKMPVLLTIKNILDRFNPILINKIWKNRFSFEVVGNYIFKISEREIEKIAMGMGLRCIAFKRLNIILDFKIDSSIISETPKNEKYWKKIQRKYMLLDLLCYLHIIPYNHLCCVVFKTQPDTELLNSLKASGYTIIELPKNPYLNSIE